MSHSPSIGTGTRLCAVIGNPVSHSLSPAIHNAAFRELGLDYVYVAFRVEDVKNALAGMRSLENFRGLSVTIPHKIEVMKHVDEVDDTDRSIGSINTVINSGGRLQGMGTDGPGALKALTDAGVAIVGKNILVLGSGGAARAISFTLARRSRPSMIMFRDVDEQMMGGLAQDLRRGTDTPVDAVVLSDSSLKEAMEQAHIIINCTPIGMHPKEQASLVPAGLFRKGQVVFDIVYTPLKTRLLSDAISRGLQVISGVEMFISQACLQFEQFTGVKAPEEVMRRVVMEKLESTP